MRGTAGRPGADGDWGVSPFSERAPGLYFAAGVPSGQSSVCWALELALGRGA